MLPIATQEHLQLIALITVIATAAIHLEAKLFRGAVSGVVYALLGGLLASNCHVMPFSAPAYDFVTSYLLVVGISLLLMRTNVRSLIRDGGPVLQVFGIGTIGTISGAWLAAQVVDLGPAEAKLAGMFTGTFIGGSVNFVSVSQIVELDDPNLFSAAVASDIVVGIAAVLFLITAPSIAFFRWAFHYRRVRVGKARHGGGSVARGEGISLSGLMLALAVAIAIAAVGELIADGFGAASTSILFVTVFVLAFANCFPRVVARMRGDADLGLVMMYLFFVVIGLQSNIVAIVGHGAGIVVFAAIVVLVHFAFVLVGGRLLGISLPEILIGSNACVTGPVLAFAQAVSEGWDRLKAPAVLVGVFGYAIGTFLGVAVATLL